MKIIFIGSVKFSADTLRELLKLNANIVGICTLKYSKFNSDHHDLSEDAKLNGIPYLYVNDINGKKELKWIKDKKPDIVFCFGWSRLLKKELLEIPVMGVVGYHPADLPSNRGRHPLIWALVLGLSETASTFFKMDEGADTGDIISKEKIEILYSDNAKNLYDKMTTLALRQIRTFFPLLVQNKHVLVKQDDLYSNTWRKRSMKDGEIDWRMSANSIYNLIRALHKPYIGAHFYFNEKKIVVWKAKVIINNLFNNIEYGKVVDVIDKNPIIKCGEDLILLEEFEGKNLLNIGNYIV